MTPVKSAKPYDGSKLFGKEEPLTYMSKVGKVETITEQIMNHMPHVLTGETKLIILLTKSNITNEELHKAIMGCSKETSRIISQETHHLFGMASGSETTLERIREKILFNNVFWEKYYQDTLLVYRIKKFKTQLCETMIADS